MNHCWIFFSDQLAAKRFTVANGGTVHTDDGIYANGTYTMAQAEQAFDLGAYRVMPVIPVSEVPMPEIVKYDPAIHGQVTITITDDRK